MKIRTARAEFSDALTWVSQLIAKNPVSPAMAGIKIVAGEDRVHLSAFDHDVSHEATLRAEVVTPGEALVSANFLRTIVSRMRGSEVQLVLDGGILTVESGRSTYGAQALALTDYPTLPEPPAEVGTIDASELLAGLNVVMHPIDDGSPHEQVRGLRIEADETLELVGMGLFRIATVALPWTGGKIALTAPGKAVHAAAKGMNGVVSIGVDERGIGLADEQRRVTIRALQPGFNTVWPQMVAERPGAPNAVVDAAELSDAVKRAGAIAEKNTWLAISFGDGEVLIDIDAHEAGAGQDSVEAEINGEASDLLNPAYLAAALDAVPSGPVRLSRIEKRPWQIHPLDHPNIRLAVMGTRKASS